MEGFFGVRVAAAGIVGILGFGPAPVQAYLAGQRAAARRVPSAAARP